MNWKEGDWVDGLFGIFWCVFTFHISVALNWWNVSRTEMKAVLFVDLITQGKQLLLVACSLCYSSFSLLKLLRTAAFLLSFLQLHIFLCTACENVWIVSIYVYKAPTCISWSVLTNYEDLKRQTQQKVTHGILIGQEAVKPRFDSLLQKLQLNFFWGLLIVPSDLSFDIKHGPAL